MELTNQRERMQVAVKEPSQKSASYGPLTSNTKTKSKSKANIRVIRRAADVSNFIIYAKMKNGDEKLYFEDEKVFQIFLYFLLFQF